jgi:hypothetical protein
MGVGVIVVICFYRYLMLPKTWAGILDRQLLEYIEKYNGRDNEDFLLELMMSRLKISLTTAKLVLIT